MGNGTDQRPIAEIHMTDQALGAALWMKLLSAFRGRQAFRSAVDPPRYTVMLYEYPNNAEELDHLLKTVQLWLSEVGLPRLEVELHGQVYDVEPRVINAPKVTPDWSIGEASNMGEPRRLYWKFEDGPEDAASPDPNDVGPAWIEFANGQTKAVNSGEWLSRAEARRLAKSEDLILEEDQ
jgi:hypothetical protein